MDEAGLNAFGRPDDDDVRIDDEAKERSCFPRGYGPHISKPRYRPIANFRGNSRGREQLKECTSQGDEIASLPAPPAPPRDAEGGVLLVEHLQL